MTNFFQQLIDTYQKGTEYDSLYNNYLEILKENKDYQEILLKEREQFTKAINDLENENALLHNDLQNDLEDDLKPILDTFSVERYFTLLKKKMPSGAYKYPFMGDGNSIDIKFSLVVKDQSLVTKYSTLIDKAYSPSSPLEIVEAVTKYFAYKKKPKYVSDSKKYDLIDVWSPVEDFLSSWTGDCDDVARAMHVLIKDLLLTKGYEEHYNRLFLHIHDNYMEGHANNLWMHEDGFFYTVESTIDIQGTYERKWLKCPLAYDSFYKKTRGIANINQSFKGVNALRDCYK